MLPNAWDATSARAVVDAGFPVVATTSSGVAAALGYVPKESKNGETTKEAQKSDVTKTTETKKEETTTTTDTKPVSPSVGSGAKIDTQGEGKKTPFDDLWGKTGKILFGR